MDVLHFLKPTQVRAMGMEIKVIRCGEADAARWDGYVASHPLATNCHLWGWKRAIELAYGHEARYLVAESQGNIVGVLPMIAIPTWPGRRRLVSLPFLSYGGILSDSPGTQDALLEGAMKEAAAIGASGVELRQLRALEGTALLSKHRCSVARHKVRLVLSLATRPDQLLSSFKAKLRSQIRKSLKESLRVAVGREELLEDFYAVFCRNMRDLGSPVHSKDLFLHLCRALPEWSRLAVVYRERVACAGAVLMSFRDTLEVPWASSLRVYRRLGPNMFLYWKLLERGCEEGFRSFDFGRSTEGDGTYRFKAQWGATTQPLCWYDIGLGAGIGMQESRVAGPSPARKVAAAGWGLLPLWVANRLGPKLRRRIPL